jgi:hypothetical protein
LLHAQVRKRLRWGLAIAITPIPSWSLLLQVFPLSVLRAFRPSSARDLHQELVESLS